MHAPLLSRPEPHGSSYPHAHDPELEAHEYERLASGRFCLVRTTSGRFYACIEVENPPRGTSAP